MRATLNPLIALLAASSLSACMTWSRDVEVTELKSDTPLSIQVPHAWTHFASKLDLCINVAARYKPDPATMSYRDETGQLIRLIVRARAGTKAYDLSPRFYVGNNLSCYGVASDKYPAAFEFVEISSAPAAISLDRAYWYWGHYL